MSKAEEAIGQLDKAKWAGVDAQERLNLLQQIQLKLYDSMDILGTAEASMKNQRMGEEMYSADDCKLTTVCPIANNVNGAIDLYTSIVKGNSKGSFEPGKITKVVKDNDNNEDLYDIAVAPLSIKEKIFYGTRHDRLRVKGEPKRVGPYEKTPKTIAILGAGNYSSAVEIIKAVFYDNCVVAHKPHPLNADIDKVWMRILEPIVSAGALSFCAADQGAAMTSDKRIDAIYFTGGADTARSIMKSSAPNKNTPLVCESGGVNPTLIVPGDREWKESELAHHAKQIVSMGKCNGGHVCARPQLIVTCKNWPQRQAFVDEIEKAIRSTTFAIGSYYPGSSDVQKKFQAAYPNNAIKRIQPENGTHKSGDVLLVTGDSEDGFGCKNEAFCQVFVEVPLDTAATAAEFLPYATDFCNNKVSGTLCASVILDETTRKNNEAALDKTVTDLVYGSIGINIMAAHVFFSQYLIWGGSDKEGAPIVSGKGHFGNVFGFENVQKSIIDDAFVSPGQLEFTNKAAMSSTISALASYSAWPSWYNLARFLFYAIKGSLSGKDW